MIDTIEKEERTMDDLRQRALEARAKAEKAGDAWQDAAARGEAERRCRKLRQRYFAAANEAARLEVAVERNAKSGTGEDAGA